MKHYAFRKEFSVGEYDIQATGDGLICIQRTLETLVISIDELNEISDKAHAHKIAWEDQEFNQVNEEN